MPAIPMGDIPAWYADRFGAGRLCVVHPDESLSWGEMAVRANRRAVALKRLGVRKNDLVALVLPNENAVFELAFALWKLGATPCVISPRLPAAELSAILDVAGPSAIFASDPAIQQAAGALPAEYGLREGTDDVLPSVIGKHWKAITSGGSSGRPKVIIDLGPGAVDPDEPLLNLPQGGTVLNAGPLYHNAPFRFISGALHRGNSVVSMPRFDAEEALRLIEHYRVAWANLVPTMMNRIWSLPEEVRSRYDVSSLEAVWHTAAPMPAWLKEAWIGWLGPEKVWEIYGGTERQGNTVISGTDWLTHRGSVGRPINCHIRIVGEDGQELGCNEVGEIQLLPVTGAGSTYRYLGAEPRRSRDGYESIGDFGWLDEDGFLYIADRRDDLIIRGGMNIYPAEIENALSEHPGVDVAVVIGLPDRDLGSIVHAIVQRSRNNEKPVTAETLSAFLATKLARYKLPAGYEFTEQPLRDEAGKVRRSRLRAERIALRTNADVTPADA
ncbi:AMP-binding protein [Amycolatopsis pithecellobii]|uniref:AMP-binding protein n=1 Tax=Amycolatopsis pithecellobii TaxID=664692 RepID=A0A6N7ZB13_9PSEU|nr:AMP-binding protein [Amycolatopsis pithecellobii]MTD58951.1 AMP-binding protein [Amycolatopsis pithecellobii]